LNVVGRIFGTERVLSPPDGLPQSIALKRKSRSLITNEKMLNAEYLHHITEVNMTRNQKYNLSYIYITTYFVFCFISVIYNARSLITTNTTLGNIVIRS